MIQELIKKIQADGVTLNNLAEILQMTLDISQNGIAELRAQVEDLKAGEAESKAAAGEYGVLPDETHAQFIKRVLGDLSTAKEEARRERERANRINVEAEENMKKLWKCANDLGRADYEPLWSFMDRQAAEIGKLNSTHADDIARIDGLSARLAAITAEASECGAEEGESVIDFLKRQDAEIEKEGTRAFEAGESLKMWKQDAQDKGQELLKVRAWHEEKLQKIRELEAERVSLMAAGKDSVMEYAYKVADGIGRMEDETLAEYMTRTHDELQSVKNDRAKAKKEMDAEFTRLLAVAKTNDSYTKEANEISKANGRSEGESLGWFIDRICAESKRKDQTVDRLQKVLTAIHGAAKSSGLRQGEKIGAFIERLNAEMYKVRCDAASESLKMGNANKQIQRSYEESRLRSAEELKTARAESLRARTELSEIAKIVNPESENGPVIDFVQAMTNRLSVSHRLHSGAVQERNNAQEEVRKLSAELAKETRRLREYEDDYAQIYSLAAAAGMQGNESVKQCLERKLAELSTITADRDRIRAELAAILAEANKSGRCSGDPVALIRQGQNDLDARIAAEREAEDIKKRWRALNDHASLKGMYVNETTAEFITRQYRLAVERQEGLDRASETIRRLTSDLENAIVDKVLAGNGAKEVARLSDLVASLQVELDEAKGQYSGIMAQLGNETPLQLIERMQRLAADQRASTIPHDERAALVGEIADLRKRLEKSQRDHAEVAHELNTARNGANECGMQAGEKLRAFIYRKRAELLDALHANDRIQLLANERADKLRAALETVEKQSAAIAEAKQATEKYTEVVQTAAKLRDWAFTIRHKVLVKLVHDKAMIEYDTIMKELDGKAGTDGR